MCIMYFQFQNKPVYFVVLCLQALVQMKNWYMRFPTILQACESIIQMLRGQYAHYVGCYSEAAFHYLEGAKVNS